MELSSFNDTTSFQTNMPNMRIVIITGANSGIGYETALELSKRGDKVILACRNMMRAQMAANKIKKETKNNNIEIEKLDLADFSSIKEFAKIIIEKYDRLDVLINSAGVMMCPYWKTNDGFEMQFGVNYLGHFLLTNLLLDLMKKTPSSRIINLSSKAHSSGFINWNDLNFQQSYNSMKALAQSKLANVMFTIELAERLKGTNVSVVCCDPGLIHTELSNNSSGFLGCLIQVFRPLLWVIGKNSKEGAKPILYCANMINIAHYHGSYFRSTKIVELSNKVKNPFEAKRLWSLSLQLVQLDIDELND